MPPGERTLRRGNPALLVIAGFLAGVMVAVLVAADRPSTVISASPEGRDAPTIVPDGSPTSDLGASDLPESSVEPGAQGAETVAATGGGGGASGAAPSGPAAPATDGASPATPTNAERDREPPEQRGVGPDVIRLGVALPDIGAIAALGPGYDQGNLRDHVESIVAAWRRDAVLPIAGRELEISYRTFNILSQEEQRATCVGFGQDDEVFAVVAIHNYTLGAECVATEYGLPVITANGPFEPAYRRAWPWMFTMEMSASRVLRNFVAWGDETGRFDGKRIGVYYSTDPASAPDVKALLIEGLERRGHRVVSEVTTDTAGAQTGGPNDTVAVQRFRTAEVDLALLVVSPVAKTNFFNQAQAQGYEPDFLETDLAFATTTTGTSTYPADYFDGTVGVTGQRFGEGAAGIAETPESAACGADFTEHTGRRIDRQGREAEYIAGNQACDEFRALRVALDHAGRNLTRERLVQGLQTIRSMRMGIHGDVTFGPDRHDGVATFRELLWQADCRCWVAQGAFQPLKAS